MWLVPNRLSVTQQRPTVSRLVLLPDEKQSTVTLCVCFYFLPHVFFFFSSLQFCVWLVYHWQNSTNAINNFVWPLNWKKHQRSSSHSFPKLVRIFDFWIFARKSSRRILATLAPPLFGHSFPFPPPGHSTGRRPLCRQSRLVASLPVAHPPPTRPDVTFSKLSRFPYSPSPWLQHSTNTQNSRHLISIDLIYILTIDCYSRVESPKIR